MASPNRGKPNKRTPQDPYRIGAKVYVRYDLYGTKDGEEGYYEVGGYWTGKAFVVRHRFFNPGLFPK